ncbi:MAG: complex I subunit 1/NuoH family protein [Myxococcaceae bacterium]
MRALNTILVGLFILFLFFAGMTAAYWLSGVADEYLFVGAGRLTNLVFLSLVFVMVIAASLTIGDRKWGALMQDRMGPNRARLPLPGFRNNSLGGMPHLVADALKMLTKEPFIPATASKFLFNLAPVLGFGAVVALFAVVPAGPTVPVLGHAVSMVVATPDFGLLYIFAIASLAVYGTSLAGWSSNNKLGLLGGVRASSQMISYEVALGLSLVGMMIAFGTVRLATDPATGALGMTDAQAQWLWKFGEGSFDIGIPAWGIILQPVGFLLFFAAAFAESKRAPFDLPEAESEILGYFVEYSGMQFGLFLISEYVEVVVLAGIITAVFFGGYHLPFGEAYLASLAVFKNHPWLWGACLATVFWVKVLLVIWLQMLVRWTFPRFRYDHIQRLGWKMLLPLGLVNLFVSGALILWDPSLRALAVVGFLEIGVVLAFTLTSKRAAEPHEAPAPAAAHH